MSNSQKKLAFNVMSDTECVLPGCNRKIKQRLVDVRPGNVHKCYPHHVQHEAGRQHFLKGKLSIMYTGGH